MISRKKVNALTEDPAGRKRNRCAREATLEIAKVDVNTNGAASIPFDPTDSDVALQLKAPCGVQ